MSETDILQGEIIITGKVHGQAMNCTVVPFDAPQDWYMVQFVSQLQLDEYAKENKLAIRMQEKDNG